MPVTLYSQTPVPKTKISALTWAAFSAQADQPVAILGTPFDLNVLPAGLHWPATSFNCGRISSYPWPDVQSLGPRP
eukprot:1989854-Rhodomonas_salina.1